MDDFNSCRRLTTLNKSVHMKLDINSKKPLVSSTRLSVTNKVIYYMRSIIGMMHDVRFVAVLYNVDSIFIA